MRRKRQSAKSIQPRDYVFEFKHVKFKVSFEQGVYSDEEAKEIENLIEEIGDHIYIDKSYVDYKGTKYEKNFMREQGWNELCELVTKTNFGLNATKLENQTLLFCFTMMIQCYVYLFLDDLDIDINNVYLEVADNTRFLSHIVIDKTNSWEKYPGKWQTWGKDIWEKLLP